MTGSTEPRVDAVTRNQYPLIRIYDVCPGQASACAVIVVQIGELVKVTRLEARGSEKIGACLSLLGGLSSENWMRQDSSTTRFASERQCHDVALGAAAGPMEIARVMFI